MMLLSHILLDIMMDITNFVNLLLMKAISKLSIGTRFKTYPNGEEYVVIAHNATRFGSYRVKARSFQTGLYHYFDWHILVFVKPYDYDAF